MGRTFKFILSGIIALLVVYLIHFGYHVFFRSHSSSWKKPKEYLCIFKDSARNDISDIYYSFYTKHDCYNYYTYKGDLRILVWELKRIKKIDLKNISIEDSLILEGIVFEYYEILNKSGRMPIQMNIPLVFNKGFNINLNEESVLERYIDGPNYRGFVAHINKMSLSNEYHEHQVIFDYTRWKAQPSMVLFYNGPNGLMLIVMDSKIPFDEKIINIFNFNENLDVDK